MDGEDRKTKVSETSVELKDLVKNGYDTAAARYLAWAAPRGSEVCEAYLTKLLETLSPGASVLELGCGAGVPCTQMLVRHELGLKVTGVDISQAQIELAREHVGPKATLVRADMTELEFEDECFDAVVAFYSIFHLPGEEQVEMVGQIVKWLKPGGIALFNLATEEGDLMMDDWMGVKMFSTGFGVEGNRKMLEQNGFGLKVEETIVPENVGSGKVSFHWIWGVKE